MADDKQFCERLRDMIKDEHEAPGLYGKILEYWKEYLPVEDTLAREVIQHIVREEQNHARLLEVIQSMKCPINSG